MITDLTTNQPGSLARADELTRAGQVANQIAGAGAFTDYRARRAANTIRRQDNDLRALADFLRSLNLNPGDLATDPEAWRGMSWGIVAGFIQWLLRAGYAVQSVNVRLSTVKVYAAQAAKAGALDPQELALIKAVHGYKRAEGKHIDELRDVTRRAVRSDGTRAYKKAQPVTLTPEQAGALKAQPDTPQGRRDKLIMCLFLDHGLRVGEVARLAVADFDLKAGELHFYRPKVDKVQTHRLTHDTLQAARAYLAIDAPALGPVLRGSRKGKGSKHDQPGGGVLTAQGMTPRAITERVKDLGALLGIIGLSAHDCRHYWATQAARNGTPLDRLQDAGGWSSLAMPARYIEAAKIANQGVRLG
jgi:integrase